MAPPRGLQAEYLGGDRTDVRPALTTIDQKITTASVGLRWSGAAPQRFSVHWFGYLTVPRTGRYTFTLTSDDGSMLSIDGRSLVDHGGVHSATAKAATVDLSAGPHPVLIELRQEGGTFAMEWQWAAEGERSAPVPSWALTPYKVPAWRVRAGHLLDVGAVTALLAAVVLIVWRLLASGWTPARHPRLAALALFVGLACVHTWPIATDPGHLTRHDNRDMLLNEWIIAWVAHQATHAPLHLYDGNIFYPEARTLAYSEPMIVQAAMAAPLFWFGASAVLAYNLVLIAGFALTGWSMALVVRRWTNDWPAGLVSGCIFGFCSHALTRIPHLQAQHVEFLPMALLALDTLLRRPTTGHGVKVAFWCVLQGLTSIYLLAITIFVMAAGLLARPAEWLRRTTLPALKALLITALVAGILLLPFLLPYYRVSRQHGLSRSLTDAANYSAKWNDYVTTPARIHASTWSGQLSGDTGLFPGALGLLLTLVALVRGVAFRDPRARMCLVIGIVGVYLSFGPKMPGYAALYSAVPLLQGIRATARFGYMATMAVAVLAGFGVVALRGLLSARAWPAAAIALVTLAAFEPLAAPLGLTRFDGITPVFDRLPRTPGTVVVEMPFPGPRSAQFHAHSMLNSTRHWQPIVNGYSGFQPASFYTHAAALQGFPDDGSVQMLHQIGVTHVVVHTSQYDADGLRTLAARPELQKIDEFGETEVYRVRD